MHLLVCARKCVSEVRVRICVLCLRAQGLPYSELPPCTSLIITGGLKVNPHCSATGPHEACFDQVTLQTTSKVLFRSIKLVMPRYHLCEI